MEVNDLIALALSPLPFVLLAVVDMIRHPSLWFPIFRDEPE